MSANSERASLVHHGTGIGGPAERLESDDAGVLVTSADPRALAEVILQTAAGREPAQWLREGGRKRFQQHFTAPPMAEELELHLREFADRA